MIKFKGVKIKGFGSILDLEYQFKPGLNIIKAINGVGKTTIFNAWYWCLTGDTLKPKCSINTWDHIRPLEYLGTIVSTDFTIKEDTYEIIRCHNFIGRVAGGRGNNRLIIKKNGEVLNIKTKAETQKYINNLLGYSPELLKSTLVFGQKLKRLIDETGTNKKEILEEAFDLVFIKVAQEKVKKRKQAKLSEYSPLKLKYESLNEKIKGKRELLKMAKENEEEQKEELQSEIKEKEKEIDEMERDLDIKISINNEEDLKKFKRDIFEYDKKLKKLDKKKERYYEISGLAASLIAQSKPKEEEVKKVKNRLKKLKKQKTSSSKRCSWCTQILKGKYKDISDNKFTEEIKNTKSVLKQVKSELNNIKSDLKAKNRQLSSLKEVIDQYNIILNNKKKLEEKAQVISHELNSVPQHEQDIEKAKQSLEKLKTKKIKKKSVRIKLDIIKLKRELKPIKKEVSIREKELEILEWLVSDPLSNSGLKAFIFNDMLHLLNEKMNKYSRYFGFKVEFDVNMESARKDIDAFIYKEGEIIPYQDLSGGQAQFVAVVMAFGLHDIVVKGNKATNVLLMDEIFEGLSQDNVEKVTEIIRSKMGNLSVNLITHRSEFNPYNSRIIRLKSKEGQTVVENL